MTSARQFPLAAKPALTENLVFIDGIGRSGKKLTCKIVSHLVGFEYFQYASFVENTAYTYYLGQIGLETAAHLIQVHLDEAIYNRAIGRNLNGRRSDETCIFRDSEADTYLARAEAPDGAPAMTQFNADNRVSVFHTHSVLGIVEILFAAYPYLKLLHITRHPVDIAEDWRARGAGHRWGTDPLVFSVTADSKNGPVPWYAAEWAEVYHDMTPAERCVEGVIRHQERDRAKLKTLGRRQREGILQIALEQLIPDSHRVVAEIAEFMGSKPHRQMAALLAEENCPAPLAIDRRRKNLEALAGDCSDAVIGRLMACAKTYEDDWDLQPIGQ